MSENGARFWGRHGAAGLLLRAPMPGGAAAVLLQHRAPWSHQGGTWALPGGARDSHETPEQAAVREAHEEAGLPAEQLTVRTTVVTAEVAGIGGTQWTYTTVIADAAEPCTPCPTGRAPSCAGSSRIRSRTCRCIPGLPRVGSAYVR